MQTLTVCTLLVLICLQSSLGEFSDMYFTWSDRECFGELGLDEEVVKAAFSEHFTLQEGNPKINEFVICTFKKTNYLNEDGSINADQLKQWVRRDFFQAVDRSDVKNKDQVVDKVMTACEDVEGVDIGDTAIKVYNCLVEHVSRA